MGYPIPHVDSRSKITQIKVRQKTTEFKQFIDNIAKQILK